MKKTLLILIGLIFLCAVAVTVSAVTISNPKIGGQPLTDWYKGGFWTTQQVVNREPWMKQKTITFDFTLDPAGLNWDQFNPAWVGLGYPNTGSYPYSMCQWYVNISIGSEIWRSDYKEWYVMSPWWNPFAWYWDHSTTNTYLGEESEQQKPLTPTANGTYTFTYKLPERLAYDAHTYTLTIYVSAYPKSGPLWGFSTALYHTQCTRYFIFNTYGPTVDKKTGTYDPTWGWSPLAHYAQYKQNDGGTWSISLGKSDPPYLDVYGGDAVGRGMTFDTSALYSSRFDDVSLIGGQDTFSFGLHPNVVSKVPITVMVCDKNHTCLAYGQKDSYVSLLSSHIFQPYGPAIGVGNIAGENEYSLLQYTVGKNQIESRKGYYVYIGYTNPFNYSNTYLTIDSSLHRCNWSTNKVDAGYIVTEDHTRSQKFIGAMTYFETYPAMIDTAIQDTALGQSSYIYNFKMWCIRTPPAGLGIPWMPVLLGFLIPIALFGGVYYYMRKWQISLPNYLYSILGIGGLYASFAIGLLDLWMLVFIAASLIMVSLYQFREPISTAIGLVSREKGTAFAETQLHRLKTSYAQVAPLGAQIKKDMGTMSVKGAERAHTRQMKKELERMYGKGAAGRKNLEDELKLIAQDRERTKANIELRKAMKERNLVRPRALGPIQSAWEKDFVYKASNGERTEVLTGPGTNGKIYKIQHKKKKGGNN